MDDLKPLTFIRRNCGCTYYHHSLNEGYMLYSCESSEYIYGTRRPIPPPSPGGPYTLLSEKQIARFFESLMHLDAQATIGTEFISLIASANHQIRRREETR